MSTANLEIVRVDALFVSDVACDDPLTPTAVRQAVMDSVHRYGTRGCSTMVAAEFERHPEVAVPRMSWVKSAIRMVYPTGQSGPPRRPTPSPIAA